MANERNDNQKPADNKSQQNVKDLDVRKEDVDKVKGGRAGDPCDGGEATPRPPQ